MTDFRKDAMFHFLVVLSVCCTAGYQSWSILFDNFVVNTVGLEGLFSVSGRFDSDCKSKLG